MPGKTYESIGQTITLSSPQQSIVFNNISQNYTDLILVGNVITSSSGNAVTARINGLTGTTDYGYAWMTRNNGANISPLTPVSDSTYLGLSWFTTPTTAAGFILISEFLDYTNTSMKKTVYSRSTSIDAGSTYRGDEICCGTINTTNAITSIELQMQFLSGTVFNAGTSFTLYGIARA